MIPTLVNNPLFRGITPERLLADLEEISFHTRSYKKGEILARQGDVCNRLVILTKGSVRGEMIDYSGRLIKVEDIAAPRALAPLFLFGEENRFPVEVTANEPTEVIEIPKASVLELFRRNEQFLENYMNLSANYARTLSDKLFFMSFKTIRQKIASYLLQLLHICIRRRFLQHHDVCSFLLVQMDLLKQHRLLLILLLFRYHLPSQLHQLLDGM